MLQFKLKFNRGKAGRLLEQMNILKPRWFEMKVSENVIYVNSSDEKMLKNMTIEIKDNLVKIKQIEGFGFYKKVADVQKV